MASYRAMESDDWIAKVFRRWAIGFFGGAAEADEKTTFALRAAFRAGARTAEHKIMTSVLDCWEREEINTRGEAGKAALTKALML